MEAAGSRMLLLPCSQGGGDESMRLVFREGIELVINFCSAIEDNVSYGYLGSDPNIRIHDLCDRIFSCFIQSNDPPTTKTALKELLHSFLDYPLSHNKCIKEVSDELLAMYQECLRGDFTSIQLLKEANTRRPMWKQLNNFQIPNDPGLEEIKKQNLIIFHGCQDRVARKVSFMKKSTLIRLYRSCKKNNQEQTLARKSSALNKQKKEKTVCMFGTESPSLEIIKEPNIYMQKQANSSEVDGSRVLQQGDFMTVFKEGISLYINNLWARHFSISMGVSNPIPMLQYLADVIFFWFTQTIKPLSLDHIKKILKKETYCLPYGTMHYHLVEEGAKKLMVLYEDCLQGNFSSVYILREESLSLASSFEETTDIPEKEEMQLDAKSSDQT
ncbi:SNW domain-containing protein 1 [Orobanche gracilis]